MKYILTRLDKIICKYCGKILVFKTEVANMAEKTRILLILSFIIAFIGIIPNPVESKNMDKVILQLRWNHQFQFAGFYAADWMGYYEREGLDVEIRPGWVDDSKVLNAVEEVLEGRADFGIGSIDILLAEKDTTSLCLVASIFQRSLITYYMDKDIPFNSIVDITKLKVGRREKDLLDIELQSMLIGEGIDPNILPLVDENETFQPEDILQGKYDVIPGVAGGIIEYYADKDGINLKSIKPVDFGIDFYGDSIFTTKELAYTNPELVERFRRASIKGWQYALENPEEIILRMTEEFSNPELRDPRDFEEYNIYQSKKIIEHTLYPIVQLGNMNPHRWSKMCESLTKLGLMDKCIDMEEFIFDYEKVEKKKNEIVIRRTINILIVMLIFTTMIYIARLSNKNRLLKLELEENKRKEGIILYQSRLAAMGEMIGNIAHQWRQPLNNLNLLLSNIEDCTKDENIDVEYINTSVERGKLLTKQMSNTIDDFRYFFNPRDKKENFHILDGVKLTLDILDDKIRYRNINLLLDNISLVKIYGYKNQYAQALFNIINNSIDALALLDIDEKRLIISIYEEGDMGACEIVDNGGGIEEEIQDKIFEPYFTTKESQEGTGLGLYMTNMIIKNMGGRIEWKNTSDGVLMKVLVPKGRMDNG